MEGLFEVFWSGKELKPSANRGPGTAGGVEAYEENRINSQVIGGLQHPDEGGFLPTESELVSLPAGGHYDHLLEPGRGLELLSALASIFKNDPPVNCGANAELVGLSCAFGERYPKQVFSPAAVARQLQLAKTFWDPRPKGNVQNIVIPQGSRLIVVGDVHGQLEDVLWMFFKYGVPSKTNQYLFNGDIVDRGGHSLEILLLLLGLKRDDPNAVYLQRGNHEDIQCGIHFGFRNELQNKFGSSGGLIWNLCGNMLFPLMPLVSSVLGPLTGGRRFGVLHGGVPVGCPGQQRPVSLEDDIGQLNRKVPTMQVTKDLPSHIFFNLLWADPAEGTEVKRGSTHGRGNRFLQRDTEEFCEMNGLAFIVRSHEVPRNLRGAVASHGGKCFTVFSASNYMGSTGNRGGVFIAEVGKGLQLREHFAPPWPTLAEITSRRSSEAERAAIVDDWEKQFNIARPDGDTRQGDGSPRSSSLPPVARSNNEEQEKQFVMQRICENKDQLFLQFRKIDQGMSGSVSLAQWIEVMYTQLSASCPDVLTQPLLQRLAKAWGLGATVGYVRFLHRFQIKGPDDGGSAPDLMREVSKLRRQLIDAPAQIVERLLDPNGDRTVSRAEFIGFLPQFNIDVPPLHAGWLYETMTQFVKQNPLTLDSTILCLSLMTRDPPPQSQWSDVAESIGEELVRSGWSYAGAFRHWDADFDGYLSIEELKQALSQLPATKHLDAKNIQNFMFYVEGMGVSNRRISMFEFLRAVAPRNWAMELYQTMLKEVLKRVWICRPQLQQSLARFDPRATNKVSVDEFQYCLKEINTILEKKGRPLVSDVQVQAICEIASRGTRYVEYDHFVRGLHVVDVGEEAGAAQS